MKPIGRNTFPDFPDTASGRLEDTAGTPSFPSPATFLSVHGRKVGRPCTESTDGVVDVKCLAISSLVAKSRIVFTCLFFHLFRQGGC